MADSNESKTDGPAQAALDEIAKLCGKPQPEVPSQVVDDIRALVAERDGLLAIAERHRKRAEKPPPGFKVRRCPGEKGWQLRDPSGRRRWSVDVLSSVGWRSVA